MAKKQIGTGTADEEDVLIEQINSEKLIEQKHVPTKEEEILALRETACFEIPSMAKPTEYLSFSAKRQLAIRPRRNQLDEPKHTQDVSSEFEHFRPIEVELPLHIVGQSGVGVLLPLGLTILSGPTGSGKSAFIRLMQDVDQMTMSRVAAVEPFDDDADVRADVPTYNSVDAALSALVTARLLGSTAIPVLDSLRESLYEISGAAGSKGVTASFFTALTRVSNALAKAELTVVATLNPMDESPDYVKEFKSKLESAVPGVIWLDPRTGGVGKGKDRVIAGSIMRRMGANALSRVPQQFTFSISDANKFSQSGWAREVASMYEDGITVQNASTGGRKLSPGEISTIAAIQNI